MYLGSTGTDAEILAIARRLGPRVLVAINAPLNLPRGRCCLDDDCHCRHDPGTRSRDVERQLARERVPTLATALIKILARRGIRLAATFRYFDAGRDTAWVRQWRTNATLPMAVAVIIGGDTIAYSVGPARD